jgi:alpha-tubulin suppressor-like RCC1 family protein
MFGSNKVAALVVALIMSASTAIEAKHHKFAGGESHSLVVKDSKVYSMGLNSYGQLGYIGMNADMVPREVEGLSDIVKVDGSDLWSVALTSDGRAYIWGFNIGSLPVQVADFNNIDDIAINNNGIYVLQGGVVSFSGGANSAESFYVLSGSSEIDSVSAGGEHGVMKDINGKAFTHGWNKFGELGTGDFSNQHWNLYPIEGLPIIKEVYAGESHTLLVTLSGDVYGAGDNEWGKLGKADGGDITSFEKIDGLIDITSITAGKDATAAITKGGKVKVAGYHNLSEEGFTSNKHEVFVEVVTMSEVSEVGLHNRSLFVSGRKNSGPKGIKGAGGNRNGKLGNRSDVETHEFVNVLFQDTVENTEGPVCNVEPIIEIVTVTETVEVIVEVEVPVEVIVEVLIESTVADEELLSLQSIVEQQATEIETLLAELSALQEDGEDHEDDECKGGHGKGKGHEGGKGGKGHDHHCHGDGN